jgi:hypothetical protein
MALSDPGGAPIYMKDTFCMPHLAVALLSVFLYSTSSTCSGVLAHLLLIRITSSGHEHATSSLAIFT